MANLRKSLAIAGLTALLATPILAQDLEQTCSNNPLQYGFMLSEGIDGHYSCPQPPLTKTNKSIPNPESCNGWSGSQRQAQITYVGVSNGSNFFNVRLDCLPEAPAWTFMQIYDPTTGTYNGSMGQSGDSVTFFIGSGDTAEASLIIKAYDSFDPTTGTYGNVLGRDEIMLFRNLLNPGVAFETDSGDFPEKPGVCYFDDWFGQVIWPDYAIDDHNMVEQYMRGPSHIMDETYCPQVLVHGQAPSGDFDYPADCSALFIDGFESGHLGEWDFYTQNQ